KVRPAIFFIYDSLAAILSVPLLVYAAYWFGNKIHMVILWAHRSEYGILVAVAVVLAIFLSKSYRRRPARRPAPGPPVVALVPPPSPPPPPTPALPRAGIPSKAP